MSLELAEVCWIVNQRNEWARRRGMVRHRLYRAINSNKPETFISELKSEFEHVNSEKILFTKYTRRLRFLNKKLQVKLFRNGSAGYGGMLYGEQRAYLDHDGIKKLSYEHEMRLAIESAIESALAPE